LDRQRVKIKNRVVKIDLLTIVKKLREKKVRMEKILLQKGKILKSVFKLNIIIKNIKNPVRDGTIEPIVLNYDGYVFMKDWYAFKKTKVALDS